MMSEQETEGTPVGAGSIEEKIEAVTAEPEVKAEEQVAAELPTAGEPEAAAEPDAEAKPRPRGRPRLKLEDLQAGQEYHGKVVGLAKFGAFVDIGAVTDGLVHLTEFSSKRVRKVEDLVALGDEVDVWVKDVDLNGNRISLSMRKKPKHAIRDLRVGEVLAGVVTSTTEYGVFVDIGSDTEGLVHISEISSGFVQKPSDAVSPGDAVEVRIKDIDLSRERISLSMVGLANDVGLDAAPAMAVASEAEEHEAMAEPEERMPTVVELALRRALGELEEEEVEAVDEELDEDEAENESLGEIYERMLAEYRASKDEG